LTLKDTYKIVQDTISSLSIEYDHNITTTAEESGNPVTEYLGYVRFDRKERPKIHWAVESSLAEAVAKVPDNTDLYKQFPTAYFEFLFIFEEKIAYALPTRHSYHHSIALNKDQQPP
jgi:hypothetical protein